MCQFRGHTLPELDSHTARPLLEVINIFLLQKHFRKPLLTAADVWITVMMDGCALLGFKISGTIHFHYKAGKSQDVIFNVTLFG